MHHTAKVLSACILAVSSFVLATPSAGRAPQAVERVIVPITTTTTTTTTTTLPKNARCGQWWQLALDVGFTKSMMETYDRVVWRESRCDETQHNPVDPNGGSYGLTQVNGFWCRPSRYYPLGYLQTVGVLNDCNDLFNPETNIRAAFALVQYSRSVGLCDWSQWAWLTDCD